jgi:hypothetical protein
MKDISENLVPQFSGKSLEMGDIAVGVFELET